MKVTITMNHIVDSSLLWNDSPCWIWQGPLDKGGYGKAGHGRLAHRVSYEFHVGPIPEGLEIDHLCRRPACQQPLHLEAVTPAENTRRALLHNGNKTHCPQGHPYDALNTIVYAKTRRCRICFRETNRRAAQAARDRKRAAA